MNYGKQIFVLALVLGGTFLFTRSAQAQEAALFRELSGTVEIKAPGSTVWVSAAAGDRIEKNTLISTGFRSTAVVVLGDSVIMVRPITRLSLEEIIRNQGEEQVNLYLQTGRIRAEVKPPAGGRTDFTVRSPSVTASVRGTSFEFDTENLRVDEGRVVYSLANGRSASVNTGSISYVDETNNTVISPFEAAAELLTPAPPPGSGSGGPTGDNAPAAPPQTAGVSIGFGWD
jgi:ferric-dicitrate binding protein FerR (iron transport regulator)